MNKYRNVKTVVDGIRFDSKKEARYYLLLRASQKAGLVTFEMQVTYQLSPGIKYKADFVEHWKDGREIVTDCKGFKTAVYRLKKKLMLNNVGIKINEV